MGMSFAYGPTDDTESIATLYKALDLGINFWDTADMYGNGKNEELVSKVLVRNRGKIFIATKFGFRFRDGVAGPSSGGNSYIDASPAWIKQAAENSLKRLKIDTIDLYYAHRIDPKVPVEETVGAMADLVQQGKIRYIGLSEASANSIRRGHAGNRGNNNALVENFAKMAGGKNATAAQLALAWLLAQGEDMLPIPGTRRRKYLEENAGAVDIQLNKSDLAAIDALIKRYPVAGDRYLEASMKLINQ